MRCNHRALILMVAGLGGLLGACDQPEGDYVKTVKGDLVRKQDAEAMPERASAPAHDSDQGDDR